MSATFILRSQPLARAEAEAMSETLVDAIEPEPQAVSLVEADETRDLWRVEAYYEDAPVTRSPGAAGAEPGRPRHRALARHRLGGALARRPGAGARRPLPRPRQPRHELPPGGTRLEITAGTAFGTGHHATTRGCLLAADQWLKRHRPRRILDMGSGTGVLAIAAAKVSRARALAVDIDAEAVRVTRDNARLNGACDLVKAALALPAIVEVRGPGGAMI
jgi:ribosomal protein L11 methyltransferase